MSRLTHRLRRLEGDLRAAFACPECDDRGKLEVVLDLPGEPAPEPKGCSGCGKISVLMRLVPAKRRADATTEPASR